MGKLCGHSEVLAWQARVKANADSTFVFQKFFNNNFTGAA